MVDDNNIYTGETVCDNVYRNEATHDTGRSRAVRFYKGSCYSEFPDQPNNC